MPLDIDRPIPAYVVDAQVTPRFGSRTIFNAADGNLARVAFDERPIKVELFAASANSSNPDTAAFAMTAGDRVVGAKPGLSGNGAASPPPRLVDFSKETATSVHVTSETRAGCASGQCVEGRPLDYLRTWLDNWDGEGAPKPSDAAISRAEEILSLALLNEEIRVTDADADVLGGVALWLAGPSATARAWISFMNNGVDTLVLSDNGRILHYPWDATAPKHLEAFLRGDGAAAG